MEVWAFPGSPQSRNVFLSPAHPALVDLSSLSQDTQNQGANPQAKDAKQGGLGRVECRTQEGQRRGHRQWVNTWRALVEGTHR